MASKNCRHIKHNSWLPFAPAHIGHVGITTILFNGAFIAISLSVRNHNLDFLYCTIIVAFAPCYITICIIRGMMQNGRFRK